MAFNQLIFIIAFLPLSVLVYKFLPKKAKKPYLVFVSLVFISWGNVLDLAYVFAVTVFNYFTAKQIEQFRNEEKTKLAAFVFITGIAADILVLGYFKYFNFIKEIFGLPPMLFGVAVPIGISFVTFSLIAFLCDIYRGDEQVSGFTDFALFVTFFPKLTSGPIISYSYFVKMLDGRKETRARLNNGIERFILGLAKKMLIAGNLSVLFNAVSTAPQRSALDAWLGALAYSFMLFFDFSGYSDMAIGIGKMYGFELPENFIFPYISVNISDFWRRWHASLGSFFKNYVYIPLGGNRKGKARQIFNLFVVFALTGIWHGASYTFIIWGMYHFVFSACDKLFLEKATVKIPKAVRAFFTFIAVTVGWVFFFSDTLSSAVKYLGNMVGIKCGGYNGTYYLSSFAVLLALSAFLSLPVLNNWIIRIRKKEYRFYSPVRAALLIVIFFICIAAVVSDTYTSFLYAAF